MRLRFEQTLPLPRPALFAFFADPGNLPLLHRRWSRFRMIHHDGGLTPGCHTWFELTLAGILPVAMGFEHTACDPPCRFGERMIHGPFKTFTHLHTFDEVDADAGGGSGSGVGDGGGGGTVVGDLLEVELPWCYGGPMVMRAVVGPMLRQALRRRAAALAELVRTGELDPSPREVA